MSSERNQDGGWTRTEQWVAIGFFIALVIFGCTDVRERARVDPQEFGAHKTDLTVFTGAGAAFYANAEPYEYKNPRNWKYPYLPFLGLVMAPLAVLDTQWQAMVWFAISLLVGWGCWIESKKLYRALHAKLLTSDPIAPRLYFWCAVVACGFPALHNLQRGQLGILLAYLLLVGIRLLVEDRGPLRTLAGTACITMAAVIKLLPALPLVILCITWIAQSLGNDRKLARASWIPLSAAGSALALVFLIPGLLLGHAQNWQHLRTFYQKVLVMAVEIDPESQVETPYTPSNQSLSNAVYRLGNFVDHKFFGGKEDLLVEQVPLDPDLQLAMNSKWVATTLTLIKLALLGNLVLLAVCVGWFGDQATQRMELAGVFGLAIVASLVVSPMSRGHYFVMLLPAMLAVPAWIASMRGRWVATAYMVAPAVLLAVHYLFVRSGAGRLGILGIGITCWFVAVSAIAWQQLRVRIRTERESESDTQQLNESDFNASEFRLPGSERRAA